MKILKQEKNGNKVKFEIEVDGQEYSKAYGKVLEEASQNMKIPGFRPGKAPKNIIEQNINPEFAKEKTLDHVVESNYPLVMKEAAIEPVDYPFWKLVSAGENSPCVFSLEVEVMPEIKLGKYKGVKGKKKEVKAEDKQVDDYIQGLREEAAQIKEVSGRPVKAGDIAELDVEGSVDGAVQASLSQKKLPIMAGDNRIAPGFDDNIIGMSIGDTKEFDIELPSDYYIAEFKGKKAHFKAGVLKLIERNLPDFDDAFVKKISSFNSAEEYKADIRKRIEEALDQRAEAELKDALLEKICKETEFEVPLSIVRRETESMLNELASSLEQQGLSLDSYVKNRKITLDDLKKELSAGATVRAKAKIVLNEISKAEGITMTDDEFKAEIAVLAKESSSPETELMTRRNVKDFIEDYVMRRKALGLVLENAKID